jgi:hypothetical protein
MRAGARRVSIWLFVLVLMIPAPEARSTAQVARTVKATYLVRFGAFVSWPPSAFASGQDPFVLCVAGRDPFGPALRAAAAEQSVAGRRILIRSAQTPEQARACHLVYVGAGGQAAVNALPARAPVLVVTDAEITGREGMIHFVVVGGRVRFNVDLTATNAAGLQVSSRLLALAASVEGRR